MKSYKVVGGGGVELNVVETGNPAGRPIVFITGFTQSLLAWSKQLQSDLADDFRLVAFDLRGHGQSGKPREQEAYTDTRLWADDVNAVIEGLGLEQSILVGWSYGPLIILDHIRHYGEANIAGIHFVGGITKLGSEEAASYLTPEILALVPGLFSTDAEESVQALNSLITLFFVNECSASDRYLMLGYEASVPPFVRKALFSRILDNDDLLSRLSIPVLLTHGVDDRIVFPAAARQIASATPNAELHEPRGVGHAPFWENAPEFNARLRAFVEKTEAEKAVGA